MRSPYGTHLYKHRTGKFFSMVVRKRGKQTFTWRSPNLPTLEQARKYLAVMILPSVAEFDMQPMLPGLAIPAKTKQDASLQHGDQT